jgi:hypothetical protein
MKDLSNDWNLKIGEVELSSSTGTKYTMIVGYVSTDKRDRGDGIYVRIYLTDCDNLIMGCWINSMYDVSNLYNRDKLPPDLLPKIESQAARLGKLKTFT